MCKGFKRLALLLILLQIVTILTGCGEQQFLPSVFEQNIFCQHEWTRSTCLAPKTCTRCGATEGKIRSHEWGSTACNAPEGCIVCGTTEGMELTHTWREDARVCIYCGLDERPADDRFLDRLAEGLEAKWKIAAPLELDKKAEPTAEQMELIVRAEYDLLAEFEQETFTDEALGELAHKYVRSIADTLEAIEVYGTEEWVDRYENGAYHRYTMALFGIHSMHPITVSEENQPKLEELLQHGEVIDMAYMLIDQVFFLDVSTSDALKKYETTIENTTSLTFTWFLFKIELTDEEGNLVEVKESKVYNWTPGQKVRFNFTTTKEFHSMDVTVANWELPLEN